MLCTGCYYVQAAACSTAHFLWRSAQSVQHAGCMQHTIDGVTVWQCTAEPAASSIRLQAGYASSSSHDCRHVFSSILVPTHVQRSITCLLSCVTFGGGGALDACMAGNTASPMMELAVLPVLHVLMISTVRLR
jgi:hypothetical protein